MKRIILFVVPLLILVAGVAVWMLVKDDDTASNNKVKAEEPRVAITIDNAAQVVQLQRLSGDFKSINSMDLSPDGKQIVLVADDGSIRVVDATSGEQLQMIPAPTDAQWSSVRFTPDGTKLFGSGNQKLTLWEAATGTEVKSFTADYGSLSPDGTLIMASTYDSGTTILNADTGDEVAKITGNSIQFTPDSKQVIYLNDAGKVLTHDLTSGEETTAIDPDLAIGSITLSADGQVAATTANDDNNIRLWNMATGEMLFELTHTDYVYNISFSPDGKLLRTGGFANIVHVWDVATGEEIYQFAGLWSQFSDDSQFLFATDQDQVVLRNAATGEEVHSFTTDDYVSSVRLTPDHTLLLVWLEDATIRLWGIPKEGETIPEITPEPIPGGEPKAGRWEGDYISFTLNVDGEITQLDMSVPFGGSYCDASFDNPDGHVTASGSLRVSITATDGAQIFIGGFDGRFDSSESISGTYSVSFCGNTMSFGGDSSWSSTWAGE